MADAPVASLPQRFVIKATNGSGTNLMVSDSAEFDWEKARTLTRAWMAAGLLGVFAEWQYRWIEPRILIEEYLEDSNGAVPMDYKFLCVHGRVELIQVDVDRFGKRTREPYWIASLKCCRWPISIRSQSSGPKAIMPPRNVRDCRRSCRRGRLPAGGLYDLGQPICGELDDAPRGRIGRICSTRPGQSLGSHVACTILQKRKPAHIKRPKAIWPQLKIIAGL